MIHVLIFLHYAHKLFVHLTLLFILLCCDFLDVVLLLLGELLLTEVVRLSLFPQLVQMLFFLRNVLLCVQEARGRQDLVHALDVGTRAVFGVKLGLQVNLGIGFQIHLREVTVFTELLARVL